MKNIKIKIFAAIIVAVLAAAAVYYFKGEPANNYFSDLKQLGQKFSGSTAPAAESIEVEPRYKNDQYGFSFGQPDGFNVSDFDEGDGKIILVKNVGSSVSNNSNNYENGFQIFIAAFDEPGPITKERILKDIPDMIINGEQYIDIGGERALSFTSQDDLGGETREIWMVHGGYLYQIKGYKNFEEKMIEVLKTWKFQ